jgi:hypothetical protein
MAVGSAGQSVRQGTSFGTAAGRVVCSLAVVARLPRQLALLPYTYFLGGLLLLSAGLVEAIRGFAGAVYTEESGAESIRPGSPSVISVPAPRTRATSTWLGSFQCIV